VGLGIHDLDLQNKCLLSKWLFKLSNEDGVWQKLLKNNIKNKTLLRVNKKAGNSLFWMDVMEMKDQFMNLAIFNLKDGSQIMFWEDTWLGKYSLCSQYPNLYNIICKKHATVLTSLAQIH
jgi:hypothetical protein